MGETYRYSRLQNGWSIRVLHLGSPYTGLLRDILSVGKPTASSARGRVRQRELIDQQRRPKLALTFATAFLRFYGTPWLDEDLTKDVMHTFRSGNGATAILIDSFYISQSFPVRRSSSTATSETTTVKDSARSIVHRN
jgi:hypothetical protein